MNKDDKAVYVYDKSGTVIYRSNQLGPPSQTDGFIVFYGPEIRFKKIRLGALQKVGY